MAAGSADEGVRFRSQGASPLRVVLVPEIIPALRLSLGPPVPCPLPSPVPVERGGTSTGLATPFHSSPVSPLCPQLLSPATAGLASFANMTRLRENLQGPMKLPAEQGNYSPQLSGALPGMRRPPESPPASRNTSSSGPPSSP